MQHLQFKVGGDLSRVADICELLHFIFAFPRDGFLEIVLRGILSPHVLQD